MDIVLSPTTRHLVKAEDLAHMKPTAFFANNSPGLIVKEAALINVLKVKKIASAARRIAKFG